MDQLANLRSAITNCEARLASIALQERIVVAHPESVRDPSYVHRLMKEKLNLQKKLKEFKQVEMHLVSREATVVEQPKGKLRAGEYWAEAPAKSIEEELPGLVRKGKFCEQVIQEVRKVRYLCLEGGRTYAEIKSEYPDLAVWKVLETLSQDDRETFARPRMWGPTVGYAKQILGKNFNSSPQTVTKWLKAYRKHCKAQKRG